MVDLAARRTQQAARLRAESEILSFLAGNVLRGETGLEDLLERVRETFGMESAALLERAGDVEPWTCAGRVGRGRPVERPEDADVEVPVGDHMALALTGRVPPAEDRRVLAAFAAQAAVVLDRRRLREQADRALALAEGNRIRTALLAAVSHDLRTPLAGIKAAVSSLRSEDVEWSDEDRAELLEGIEDGADRLDHLVGNLLDMSRLHTGTVTPLIRGTDLDEVVPRALGGVPEDSVALDVPETLPMVDADPGLLERAMANVIENAVKYSPPGEKVLVAASALAGRVEVRVVDRGPGVPDEAKERIFAPFQRHGDAPRGAGCRPGPRGRARLHRGHGRNPERRRHARRRPHHDPHPARGGRPAGGRPRRRPERKAGFMTRVLVVDDDPAIVRALVINLRARQYEVDSAEDGAGALRAAAARHPDVVVLDLGLPDTDGVDVIRRLREWSRVPILVLSARHASGEKVQALDSRRRRLRHQALRHGRTARPPAGRRTARGTRRRGRRGRGDRGVHRRPRREEGPPRRT